MLLLDINRKTYVTPSHLTMSDLERSNSMSLQISKPLSRKGAELGHMLLLNKAAENCHLSYRLQVSSRPQRSMYLLLSHITFSMGSGISSSIYHVGDLDGHSYQTSKNIYLLYIMNASFNCHRDFS